MSISKMFFLIAGLAIVVVSGCKKDEGPVAPTGPLTPTVATAAVTNIGIGSVSTEGIVATSGGTIVYDGGAAITVSGICWSPTNNPPTTADDTTMSGTTSGAFSSRMIGLQQNTTYHVRAYATNSAGTGYGSVVTFTTAVDTNLVVFTYNGQSVAYGIIISPVTGKKWLDRNLGAQRTATAFNDYQAYGDLFQWGRPADGHQLINWTTSTAGTAVNGITSVVATSDVPGHNNFIMAPDDGSSYDDWRDNNNNNRWGTTPQGPCPAGWHVPSMSEWGAEVSNTQTGGTASSGGMTNQNTAYSQLKLASAGRRRAYASENGQLSRPGERGYYWSSSINIGTFTNTSGSLQFAPTFVQVVNSERAQGMSIRCIKD